MKRIIAIVMVSFLIIGMMQAQTKILGRKVFDRGIPLYRKDNGWWVLPSRIQNMKMIISPLWDCWKILKVLVIPLR